MLEQTDNRWPTLTGGRGTQIDPRPLLMKPGSGREIDQVWTALWHEFRHQGDLGEGWYACVPHLVRTYRRHSETDSNTYAIVAIIELARTSGNNPGLPPCLEQPCHAAIKELATIGAS